jgi:hypothetical protein
MCVVGLTGARGGDGDGGTGKGLKESFVSSRELDASITPVAT